MVFSITLYFSANQWRRISSFFHGEAKKLNLTLEQTLQLALLNYIETMHLDGDAFGLLKLYMSKHSLDDRSKAANILIKAGFRASEGKPLNEFQEKQ